MVVIRNGVLCASIEAKRAKKLIHDLISLMKLETGVLKFIFPTRLAYWEVLLSKTFIIFPFVYSCTTKNQSLKDLFFISLSYCTIKRYMYCALFIHVEIIFAVRVFHVLSHSKMVKNNKSLKTISFFGCGSGGMNEYDVYDTKGRKNLLQNSKAGWMVSND